MKNLKGKRTILYRRVSTTEQKKTGNSLNSQKDKLRIFVKTMKLKLLRNLKRIILQRISIDLNGKD